MRSASAGAVQVLREHRKTEARALRRELVCITRLAVVRVWEVQWQAGMAETVVPVVAPGEGQVQPVGPVFSGKAARVVIWVQGRAGLVVEVSPPLAPTVQPTPAAPVVPAHPAVSLDRPSVMPVVVVAVVA